MAPAHLLQSIRPPWSAVAIYTTLVVVLWPIPLLNILHVASAALVALVAFFVAGLHALPALNRGARVDRMMLQHQCALVVPLVLLTVSLLWAPNCGYVQGLLFFLIFPVVTVIFAVAVAYAISGWGGRRQRLTFVLVGILIVVLTPIYDLGLHPQLYTYNHVFGGVLGPIYDEELSIRSGLFVFRGLTILWALWLLLLGLWLRGVMPRSGTQWWVKGPPTVAAISMLIGLTYLFSAPLGINTTERHLQKQLGGNLTTEHFDIYFDPDALSPEEQRRVVQNHEYHYARLARILDEEVPHRIQSYIYPNADVKGALTGARETSFAPVWLATPQVHLFQPRMDHVFPHELAHVFSREFGLPVIRASTAVGLVEGLAVALEPPDGRPDMHSLVAADLFLGIARPSGEMDDLAADVVRRLHPFGFWTGRGTVSYTTMGSFVRFLLDSYGAEPLKKVYPRGNFKQVYGKSVEKLAEEWRQVLLEQPVVSRAAADHVTRRFSVPSLFERRCPHHVPRYQRHYREAQRALAVGDSLEALRRVEESLSLQPEYGVALNMWARLHLAQRQADPVIERLEAMREDQRAAALYVRLGEAYTLTERSETAKQAYASALERIPLYQHDQRVVVLLQAALVDEPDLLHFLRYADWEHEMPATLHRRLDAHPAAGMLHALRLMGQERYEQTAERLDTLRVDMHWEGTWRTLVEQQRYTLLAVLYHRLEEPQRAENKARQAASLLRAIGDFEGADQREAFADKMQWLQSTGTYLRWTRNSSVFSLN